MRLCCRPVYECVLRKIITGGDAFYVSRFPPIEWRRGHRPLPPLRHDVVLSDRDTAQLQRGQTGKDHTSCGLKNKTKKKVYYDRQMQIEKTKQNYKPKRKLEGFMKWCLGNTNRTKQKGETQMCMIMTQVWHFDFYSCHMLFHPSSVRGSYIFRSSSFFYHLFSNLKVWLIKKEHLHVSLHPDGFGCVHSGFSISVSLPSSQYKRPLL